jgi:plasmid replication initiation protein
MTTRKKLKKIVEVQKELLQEQRKYRPSQAAYRRIQAACNHLARARYAHIDDQFESKIEKAMQVVAFYDERGTRGIAFSSNF